MSARPENPAAALCPDCGVPLSWRSRVRCRERPPRPAAQELRLEAPSTSILVTDVVVARALAKKGSLTLVGSGACMEPAIKDGDAVRVDPVELREAKVGQVAVFRRDGALLAHRIVSKGGDGKAHLVTRSDANTGADDGPLYEDDFVGVVAAIERRGRPRRLAARPPDEPAWRRSARTRYLAARRRATLAAMRGLSAAQRLPAYRSLASRALAPSRRGARIVVRLPLHAAQTHDLHRELALDEALTAVREGAPAPTGSSSPS